MKGRIKEFFGSDRKSLYMILSIVTISIFSLTIVYAALSVTLNIQGNAQVAASTWDIHLDNVQVKSGSVSGDNPSITSPTTATFSTTLNMPGDFYEFTIDVVNNGSIDAMIDGVTKTPTLTETQAKYLNYIIEYQNGESINTKQLVAKESFVRLKIRVEFRKDTTASDLPATSETLNLAFTVNYVQSDGTGNNVTDNGVTKVKVVSGDYDTVGSEVCIKEECFYVISSAEDTVTMLTKYNLYVGNKWEYDENNDVDIITPLDVSVVKQDSIAIGWKIDDHGWDEFPFYGIMDFSSSSVKGEYYSDYSGSIVEGYVNDYNLYLITLGVTPMETRLITLDELEDLGCDDLEESCSNAPSWVYSTSYWTSTACGEDNIFRVDSDSYSSCCTYDNGVRGVRPVIEISKSLF